MSLSLCLVYDNVTKCSKHRAVKLQEPRICAAAHWFGGVCIVPVWSAQLLHVLTAHTFSNNVWSAPQFVETNKEKLSELPPPLAAAAYYRNEDLYMVSDLSLLPLSVCSRPGQNCASCQVLSFCCSTFTGPRCYIVARTILTSCRAYSAAKAQVLDLAWE